MWNKKKLTERFWKFIEGMKQRRLVLALSLIIGILAGLAAILLKNLTHLVYVMRVLE